MPTLVVLLSRQIRLAHLSKTSLVLLLLLLACSAQALVYSGKVVGVSDGDTITVLDASRVIHKVRLAGIDAPEKAQPFGQRSKQSLSDWVSGRTVSIEAEKVDRYGREIGKVIVDGLDINLEQIRSGMAWHYKQYAKEQSGSDRRLYDEAERTARAGRVGLWHEGVPMAPWDWRKAKRDRIGYSSRSTTLTSGERRQPILLLAAITMLPALRQCCTHVEVSEMT